MKIAPLVKCILFSAVLTAADLGFAQEIVVEATRIQEGAVEDSRSVTVITDKQIALKKPTTVVDILRDIPGVEVSRQGAMGQTTSVFIRGARSEDTLVLIDGVEANDAMAPSCGYDFSSLSPANVARIEVYRGPQSVRFGAGALGGVVNIITKSSDGPTRRTFFLEGGSYDTERAELGLTQAQGRLSGALSLDGFRTQGFSAADKRAGATEPDGAKSGTAATKLLWRTDAVTSIESTLRYSQAAVDIDRGGGDDPNDTSEASQVVAGVTGRTRFTNDRLASSLGIYFSEVDRRDRNKPDAKSGTDSADRFLSETKKIESNHEYSLGENHKLHLNLQGRSEAGGSYSIFNGTTDAVTRQQQSVVGESLTYLFEDGTWFGDVGARSDQSSRLEAAITSERLSFGKLSPDGRSKVFIAYGTGFKLPSLYQLYSSYGNRSLHHEDSKTIALTFETAATKSSFQSLTFFKNNYNNLIDYDLLTDKYINVSKAQTTGIEASAETQLTSSFKLAGSYTYTDSVDGSTERSLLRRSKNAWSLKISHRAGDFDSYLQCRYKGRRADADPVTFQRETQGGFAVMDVGMQYAVTTNLKITARSENLLDKNYEEVSGYGTAGFSLYFGLMGDL